MAIGTTAAIIGGSLIGAGASAYGADRAGSAADRASRRSRNAELDMYQQNRADLAPYRNLATGGAGERGALDEIRNLYLGSGADRAGALSRFETSPQYQFVRDEGISALENSGSARGGALSGNAVRGATQFASGLASGEFNSYVDRLFSAAGLGGSATGQTVQAGQNTSNALTNIYTNQGNARGSAYMAGAQGVNSALQGGLQNWAFNQYMGGGSPQFNSATQPFLETQYLNTQFPR